MLGRSVAVFLALVLALPLTMAAQPAQADLMASTFECTLAVPNVPTTQHPCELRQSGSMDVSCGDATCVVDVAAHALASGGPPLARVFMNAQIQSAAGATGGGNSCTRADLAASCSLFSSFTVPLAAGECARVDIGSTYRAPEAFGTSVVKAHSLCRDAQGEASFTAL